jgi:malonyl-CoA O-methyltransferase
MNIRDSYTDWATTYDADRNLTRDLDAAVTRELLAGRRYGAALELGCGTGKNTLFLSAIAGRVQALDFSAGMIAQARAKVTAANVRFALADLTRPWPCADQSVDLVVGNLVLEHIAELGAIFEASRRALRPGGQMLISELHPFRQYQGRKATFQREQAAVEIPAFVHHISEFLQAAAARGLALSQLREHWHAEDQGKPPRLLTLLFVK